MSPTDQRTIRARRSLRALFALGFFVTFFGAASSGLLLYLYWTRAQKETVPAWQAWQYPFIQATLTFTILLAICVISSRLIKRLTNDTNA
jgi:hypothetical protein